MTVTSELHAQAERTKKQKREERLHPVESAKNKDPEQRMVLKHGGAPLVADESGFGRRPEYTG